MNKKEAHEDKVKAIFRHAENICLNKSNNCDPVSEAKFLRYLASFLSAQAKTIGELDDLLGELK